MKKKNKKSMMMNTDQLYLKHYLFVNIKRERKKILIN